MAKFKCPKCGKDFQMNFFKWILTTPVHNFCMFEWRDYRKTKCPHCGEKSYMKRELNNK